MNLEEKTLSQEYIFKGRIINMRVDEALLPDGSTAGREVVEHPGGVAVAALTDEGEILMVRQFRYPYGEVIPEIPAGKLEKGEDPFESGKRELREETGATAEKYRGLGKFYPTPGYCGEIIHLYLAEGLTFGEQDLDDDEFLSAERVPFAKAVEMVMSGEIRDGKTQAAVLKMYYMAQNGELKIGK